ncbi:MAG: putative toxin-antitoxin system toxin component, PIN family [Candidatus Hydrogenedentes bacterium CG1_02_42_14]|nr:MAG: putative toxin-antitoxin system toxin component, PIN family [Candidatus Hydrogenedentes bacterium CG1_02_42_14]
MKVVLDTNIYAAAFATRGLCCDVYETCLSNHSIVIGMEILKEIRKVFSKKLKMPDEIIDRIIELIKSSCEIVIPAVIEKRVCRDHTDLHVIGTAVAGRVDCLVTGDSDLLTLHKYKWIEILSPREFWDRLSG